TTGVIFTASYMLWMIQRVFYGDLNDNTADVPAPDLDGREHLALWPKAALMLVMGVASPIWMRGIDTAGTYLARESQQTQPAPANLSRPAPAAGSSRQPLGWIAIAGTVAALFASWYQVSLGTLHAFSNTIQVDAFSVLFHYVIGAVVLVTLLGSLDYFEGNASHAGEYFALLC